MCTGPSGAGGGGTGVPSSHFSPESKAAVSGDGTASSGLGGYANASAQGFGKGGLGPKHTGAKVTCDFCAEKEFESLTS